MSSNEDICFDTYVRRTKFSKMGEIMTKKRTALGDNSLETLMRISYHKQSLNTNDVKQVLEVWRNQKERKIFSSDF